MTKEIPHSDREGLASAIGAYLIWGFLPLYLILVRSVPAFEFVAWRIIWLLPICLIIIAIRRQGPDLRAALTDWYILRWLLGSAALISVNWFVYVWAIQQDQVYAASLGYYINPLVNVLLGTLILGERLTRAQWVAVALASCGVAVLAGEAITTLWISLALALSFGTYGLLRKQVPVGAVPGLTIEAMLLQLPSFVIVLWYGANRGSAFLVSPGLSASIVLGGILTALPLTMFAIAARKLPYSTLGFIQFLAPTIVFILGLTVFHQPLHRVQAISFGFIWLAVSVFAWDLVRRSRAAKAASRQRGTAL
ncbi:EamA family transporter RarD [Porphyrobacter algicida]|uniref:EamA family transporter RarD n=1 Tax=Qipengyuania algicida TaxID=1836209 RepID=A0A845AKY8_9SPHN|nr:EamA family transporter RarD [Qipengyuania algicida]MXP30077.1 EamA family transporter RarD [Qipengyuania algicida]